MDRLPRTPQGVLGFLKQSLLFDPAGESSFGEPRAPSACLLGQGATRRRSRGGPGSPERGGSGQSGQVHYITARRPLTPRQAAARRAGPG